MLGQGLLKGSIVYLDAMSTEDLPRVTDWYSDADFLRNLDAIPSAPQTSTQLQGWYDERTKGTNGYLFAARRTADKQLVGYVELDSILWSHQVGWLVIAIGQATDRGQGYGRDALQVLLRFAFQELNLRRVQLTVFAYNESAIGLYESLGFRREGAFREFLHRDGQLFDMYLYGLLRDEWTDTSQRNVPLS